MRTDSLLRRKRRDGNGRHPYAAGRSAALLKWEMAGEVLITGVLNEGDINKTDGCKQAAELAHKF